VPIKAFREKFGDLADAALSARLQAMITEFLAEGNQAPDRKRDAIKTT
jgi:hypothetical protein